MKTTRILSLILISTLTCPLAFGFSACKKDNYTVEHANVKNVILFIGDGMGENHIENALTYFQLKAPAFLSDRKGSIATRSANNPVTDSAAAATALATGKKVDNGEIAYHDGKTLTQITQLAKQAGKKVGVITTDHLSGATPASFSAHAKNRYDRADIAQTQATSGIDLLLGEAESGNAYYNDFHALFEANGYTFAQSEAQLSESANAEKLIATLPEVRSEYNAGNETDYQLWEMTRFATEFLENENGYFLMIESAHIDKFSHSNALLPALCEVRSLFDALDFLYENVTASGETALLVTADHETGNLGKAETKADVSDSLYERTGHSATNVPLYVKNFTFSHTDETPQNTFVFELCRTLLGV